MSGLRHIIKGSIAELLNYKMWRDRYCGQSFITLSQPKVNLISIPLPLFYDLDGEFCDCC